MSHIAILGAGSWGTAVAIHLSHNGHNVCLWSYDSEHIKLMQLSRINERYLPQTSFPPNLILSDNLEQCVNQARYVIIAVPSHAFSSVLHQMPKPKYGLAWLTKGVDPDTNQLLSNIVANKWGTNFNIAMISGPSFAKEVAKQLPTALVVASNNQSYAKELRDIIHKNNMRVYLSDDLIGVQCCGAIKNILAIACGISDGLGYGANAQAALITRGLNEMRRFGLHFGSHSHTFIGLAGVGDLVLTCTDNQSRNRRFGMQLGQGVDPKVAQQHIGQVVEGVYNAAQVHQIAEENKLNMPICKSIYNILTGNISSSKAVDNLLKRPPRDSEHEDF